jgi:hypothetical protein
MLKPQDIVIVMKILTKDHEPWTQALIALQLGMSVSEVNGGIKRALVSGLLRIKNKKATPVKVAVEEFLMHGLKYVFPIERGEPTRGLPTGYAAEVFENQFAMSDELPPVWPDAEGMIKGYAVKPLYKSVPFAVKQDHKLYNLLAIIDVLRSGRAREVQLAKKMLHEFLQKNE